MYAYAYKERYVSFREKVCFSLTLHQIAIIKYIFTVYELNTSSDGLRY